MGGDLLSIESLLLPGTGNIISTGQLGDVMQESVKAAYSYVKSRSDILKLDKEIFAKNDVHIHVPEGAVPKDGPSAGVTICTAIVSALTKKKVKRDIAMTGEITLRGKILGIGGLKEKLLAASRGSIKTVYIPKENEKDLVELPKYLLSHIEIKCVSNIDEILQSSFVKDRI
jgi:ATP-dependent Lon protease